MTSKSFSFTQTRPYPGRRSIIAAAAGLALSGVGSNSARAQISTSELPDAAAVLQQMTPAAEPDLIFYDVARKRLSLQDFRGHGLVVNIWATWCGPCVAELPTLAAISPKLARSGILVLPISVDMQGANVVEPFYKSHGIHDLPVLLDPVGRSMEVLNTNGIPVTIIVTPQGQMVGRLDGSANWDTAKTLAMVRQLAGQDASGGDVRPA